MGGILQIFWGEFLRFFGNSWDIWGIPRTFGGILGIFWEFPGKFWEFLRFFLEFPDKPILGNFGIPLTEKFGILILGNLGIFGNFGIPILGKFLIQTFGNFGISISGILRSPDLGGILGSQSSGNLGFGEFWDPNPREFPL